MTGDATVALACITLLALGVTIWITITDRRNAEAARRRDRQQDSAQRLLGRIAGIVSNFDLIPDIYRWVPSALLSSPRAWECFNAVRDLEAGMYADMAGLGDTSAADQYRELVRRILAAARGVDEGMEVATSEALRRRALFVSGSLENLIEHERSFSGQPSFPGLESQGDEPGRSATEHEGAAGRHRRPEPPTDEESPSEPEH